MEDLMNAATGLILTVAAGVVTTYGARALSAIRKRAAAHMTQENIAIIDRAIASGVAYAKENGFDTSAENWLREVLGYTANSIPDTLKAANVTSEALERKVLAARSYAKQEEEWKARVTADAPAVGDKSSIPL